MTPTIPAMTTTTVSAKTRTASLPNMSKCSRPARQGFAKTSGATDSIEGAWDGIVFGPYVVPLSRRVE